MKIQDLGVWAMAKSNAYDSNVVFIKKKKIFLKDHDGLLEEIKRKSRMLYWEDKNNSYVCNQYYQTIIL